MKTFTKACTIILAMWQMLALQGASAQDQPSGSLKDHAANIRELSSQLRWRDEAGSRQYGSTKFDATQRLMGEVDGFISDSFDASSATPENVKVQLDALLGRKGGDSVNNVAFSANLPGGQFLILGVELWRGGPAINEDAISFRAYARDGNRFRLVASTDSFSDSALVGLHAQILPQPPVPGEFWLIAWADVPPRSPFTIAMRIFAFDGVAFRTVWAPENIISDSIDNAVTVTPGAGFIVSRMPDWKSSSVIGEHYTLTPGGPQVVAEINRPRE